MLKMADYLPLTLLSRKLDITRVSEIQLSSDSSGAQHTVGTGVCVYVCVCVCARACAHL